MGLGSLVLMGLEELQIQACFLPYSVGLPAPLLALPWAGGKGGFCRGCFRQAVQDHCSGPFPSYPACCK